MHLVRFLLFFEWAVVAVTPYGKVTVHQDPIDSLKYLFSTILLIDPASLSEGFMLRKKQPPKPPEVRNLEDAKLVIEALWDRLNDLEDRLNQNSRNSSRPPSSNGPGAGSSAPTKKPTGRKRGAQSGHKGCKRVMADSVDETRTYYPEDTCACGGVIDVSHSPYRRHQVFDIPSQAFTVVEHQLYQGQC